MSARVQNAYIDARIWLAKVSTPHADGLPNIRVIAALPLALLVLLIIFTGLGLTGSSSGFVYPFLNDGADPDLLLGSPRSVRSDEWLVQTSWTISQVEQGLPIVNRSFPGGMDATVQHELPSRDWSLAFRPHLLGFLFLGLDHAMAVKWWLPGFAMIAACYVFAVSLLPKRPVTAAAIAIGFFFSPFLQLWYLPITLWPAAWCFLAMATCVWLLRSTRTTARVILCLVLGYVTVTMGMGIYVPFIVPAVLVVLAFCVGMVFTRRAGDRFAAIGARVRTVLPMLAAGLVATGVLIVWLLTRLPSIERFVGTVYPGQRLGATGSANSTSLAATFGAPFTPGLFSTGGPPLSVNASEASSFILTGLFLFICLLWILLVDRRAKRPTDWRIVAVVVAGVVIAAFLLVPGWDWLAHATLLDRTTASRIRLGLGLLSVVAIVLLVHRQDSADPLDRVEVPRWNAWVATVAAILVFAVVVVLVARRGPDLLRVDLLWVPIAILFVGSVYLFARSRALLGAIAFLLASVLSSVGVNPLYRGVYDTNDAPVGAAIESLDREDPGAWVGVGATFLPTIILVQSGMTTFNGFQSAPPDEMWEWIDPSHKYEQQWNRLANIMWVEGSGDPVPENPGPDQIIMQFDSCAAFAQGHVKYVLADAPLDQACLELDERVTPGPTDFWIYQVVPD